MMLWDLGGSTQLLIQEDAYMLDPEVVRLTMLDHEPYTIRVQGEFREPQATSTPLGLVTLVLFHPHREANLAMPEILPPSTSQLLLRP